MVAQGLEDTSIGSFLVYKTGHGGKSNHGCNSIENDWKDIANGTNTHSRVTIHEIALTRWRTLSIVDMIAWLCQSIHLILTGLPFELFVG